MNSAVKPQRPGADVFRFVDAQFDPATGEARLVYAFDDGPPFAETLVFPLPADGLNPARAGAFDAALALLHLIAGVSYWKANLAPRIEGFAGGFFAGPSAALPEDVAAFLERSWRLGLGEFAYVNELDLRGRIRFSSKSSNGPDAAPDLGLGEGALVAIGGGKDSLVSLEALKALTGSHRLVHRPLKVTGHLLHLSLGRVHIPLKVTGHLFHLNLGFYTLYTTLASSANRLTVDSRLKTMPLM